MVIIDCTVGMKSLAEFEQPQEVFLHADSLPPFFDDNLVDPARVVKRFPNDTQAHIRIFYYQYLRLCFEVPNIDYQFYISRIQQTLNDPDFAIMFPVEDDPSLFNDHQAKSFIMEFFGILGEGNTRVLSALNHFPIMDYIFVCLFRSQLLQKGVCQGFDDYIERQQLLGYLCQEYGVNVEVNGECTIYTDSDTFIYEPAPNDVYLAFIDADLAASAGQHALTSSQEQSAPNVIVNKQPVKADVIRQQPIQSDRQSAVSGDNRSSYIASEFQDYTSNPQAASTLDKLATKVQHLQNQKEVPQSVVQTASAQVSGPQKVIAQPPPPQPQPVVAHTSPQKVIAQPPPQSVVQHQQQPVIAQKVQQPPVVKPSQASVNHSQQSQSSNPLQSGSYVQSKVVPASAAQEFIYRPQQPAPLLNPVAQVSPVKPATSKTQAPRKKNPFGLNISDEFTSQEVMTCMSEPFKSNVGQMKVRAREYRTSLMRYIK